MYREQRIATSCRVQFSRLESVVTATSEDMSRHGIFVRTEEFLPVGTVLELHITLLTGEEVTVIARVAHLLAPSAARSLGRRAGMGFQFLDIDNPGIGRLRNMLDDLIDELTPPPVETPTGVTVLVADPSPRLVDRLSNSLGEAGFIVETVSNGSEAYAACLTQRPRIILAAAEMPVVDGWTLVSMLAAHPRLAEVPILLMSEDHGDVNRLRAYRMGVTDFVPRPFIDEELVIRLRRVALAASNPADRAVLRGNVAEISVPTLLSLLEFERKSGLLIVLRDTEAARFFVAEGRLVKVEGPRPDPVDNVLHVTGWRTGKFEFIAGDVIGADEIGMGTTQLLLELARRRDEGNE